MASEAEINKKRLADELAKPLPDADVVYYLKTTRNYWNTVDTDAMKRGARKVYDYNLQETLKKIAKERK